MPIKRRYVEYFLVISLLFGVFIRFYGLRESFIYHDEQINMVAGIKLNHQNPYDPRLFGFEHPPIGKFLVGLPTRFIKADYALALQIPPQMFVWDYKAPYKDIYAQMRGMSALLGAIALFLLFLITKELYGFEAGLWAASLSALSFDLITYDRTTFPTASMHFFTLGIIYFYLKYLKSEDDIARARYMVLTFVFFTLNLGTRNLQPMFFIALLPLLQFTFNRYRSRENLMFLFAFLASLYLFFYVIYPPEIRKLMMVTHHGVTSSLALIKWGFSFDRVLILFSLRNSYFFAATLALLVYDVSSPLFRKEVEKDDVGYKIASEIKRNAQPFEKLQSKFRVETEALLKILESIGAKEERKGGKYLWKMEGEYRGTALTIGSLKRYLAKRDPSLVVGLVFIFSLFVFGVTDYGGAFPGYLIFTYLPISVFGGMVLSRETQKKPILALFVILTCINIYNLIAFFPNFSDYTNFGVKSENYKVLSRFGGYENQPAQAEAIQYLEGINSPFVITNLPNVRVFYKGKSEDLIIPGEDKCNPDYITKLKERGTYVVYHYTPDIKTDPYVCPYIAIAPPTLIKTFGEEERRIRVYKL